MTWYQLRFMLITDEQDIQYELNGAVGNVSLNKDIYKQIVGLLNDYKIHQVAELQKKLPDDFKQSWLFESLAILHSQGAIVLIQDDDVVKKVQKQCKKLNAYIMQQSLVSPELTALASPLTGTALTFGTSRLFSCMLISKVKISRQTGWIMRGKRLRKTTNYYSKMEIHFKKKKITSMNYIK